MLKESVLNDLAASGLIPEDIRARPLEQSERHTTGSPMNVDGYVIPYFDMHGKIVPFYRVKLFNWTPKYRQIANQPNHLYFATTFAKNLATASCIILVEGEKKAALLAKLGYAAVAVGGVDSWRNRIITMPKDIKLGQSKDGVVAHMPAGQETRERTSSLAAGLEDVFSLCVKYNKSLVILFDGGTNGVQSREVQAAAAMLGFEARFRGVPMNCIRMLTLMPPNTYAEDKLGVDDFIMSSLRGMGVESFQEQLDECLAKSSAFPRHPNIREFVNKRLQSGKMDRKAMQMLSSALISDLDTKGSRLRAPDDGSMYYFSRENRELTQVSFRIDENYAKSPFGIKMYNDYNLSMVDTKLLQWISTQYAAEDPVMNVSPKRVLTVKGDVLYYQVDNSTIARVNRAGMTFIDNGEEDVLFAANVVAPMDSKKLLNNFEKLSRLPADKPMPCYWYEVMKDVRITQSDFDRNRRLLALLYSISPWFYRWRGTQLPVEMMLGEAGSGKSTLYTLRLMIMTGSAKLRNAPSDLRDWAASVGATGALHVTDNVNMSDSKLRQELSDELCRVVTAPDPKIEKRKLYSDNELVEVPVDCVFAVTAIKQPFNNVDIIARSIITDLNKGVGEVTYDTGWMDHKLEMFGGREGWIAHQLLFQQRMYQLVKEKWKTNYSAKFRLIHVEQLLMLAAEVYGWPSDWIPSHIEAQRSEKTAKANWILEGLRQFAYEWQRTEGPAKRFGAKHIAQWAEGHEDYGKVEMLLSSRSIGHYIKQNQNSVAIDAHILPAGMYMNAQQYGVEWPEEAENPQIP